MKISRKGHERSPTKAETHEIASQISFGVIRKDDRKEVNLIRTRATYIVTYLNGR